MWSHCSGTSQSILHMTMWLTHMSMRLWWFRERRDGMSAKWEALLRCRRHRIAVQHLRSDLQVSAPTTINNYLRCTSNAYLSVAAESHEAVCTMPATHKRYVACHTS